MRAPLKLAVRSATALLLPTLGLLAGCEAELGECNIAQANRVAYFYAENDPRTGLPAYEGQALVQQACGNGFCHSPAATGQTRYGVPGGFDFDLSIACEIGTDGQCPEGLRPNYDRLADNAAVVFDHARGIFAEVEAGTMPPPGAASDDVRAQGGQYYRAGSSATFDPLSGGDSPLPELDTAEGREVLRNWLACGAPVIGATRAPEGREPGESCGVMADVGECVVRYEPPPPPDPNWDSIYEFFSGNNCVTGCHDSTAESLDVYQESLLDLHDKDTAYMELLGAAEGNACGGDDTRLIDPDDADASLLLQKLEMDEPTCGGGSMPLGRALLPDDFVAPIREWIEAGAPES